MFHCRVAFYYSGGSAPGVSANTASRILVAIPDTVLPQSLLTLRATCLVCDLGLHVALCRALHCLFCASLALDCLQSTRSV